MQSDGRSFWLAWRAHAPLVHSVAFCASGLTAKQRLPVTLVDFQSAPPDAIYAVGARFRAALNKALGDRVTPALWAFLNASEPSVSDSAEKSSAWPNSGTQPYEPAKRAGLHGLGESEEAYLEVRLG